MKVRVVKMFNHGVEVERRMLNDRYTSKYDGKLVIMDATDSGRHRPIKVARLMTDRGVACELFDVHVVWSSDNRITFTGDERIKNESGQQVCYKQSWLCTLDLSPVPEEDDIGPRYVQKAPPR
ncbi:hypothetical protein GJ698_16475 [Pseudoduganella sp. FT26W]|uniref:Uncharacterized protein n=1 Tax=Duganella aquatilis TaxID=2666082 RepID=A0A844CXY5_9BURK|nr:hypothetical protein [Duganella aquatilis]MRW85677.1 hypothetical protein [Duganella aquatilis]